MNGNSDLCKPDLCKVMWNTTLMYVGEWLYCFRIYLGGWRKITKILSRKAVSGSRFKSKASIIWCSSAIHWV